LNGQTWTNESEFKSLLMQMLILQPQQRISPDEIIEHPFM